MHHRLLTVKAVANTLGRTRVGFVVSSKVAKHAVDRNRIKRRLRDIIGRSLARLRPGYDVVFIAKKEARAASFDELRAGTERLLEKAGLSSGGTQ